jgi:glutathione S-transferase
VIRLYVTLRSPFARKVRIVLHEKGLAHELLPVDLGARDAEWFADNPIGKIPVMDLDGVRIPDSTVICETLEDRFPTPPMYEPDRLRCRILEELCDAAAEQTVVAFFARQRGDAAGAERAMATVDRVLTHLAARRASGDWPPGFGIADAAAIATLGYLELRHGWGWRDRHPALAAWHDSLAERPSVAATVPVLG